MEEGKKHYKAETIRKRIQNALDTPETFYKQTFVNYRGKTSNSDESYSELIAGELFKQISRFNGIKKITRNGSYKMDRKAPTYRKEADIRIEENLAKAWFIEQNNVFDFGRILDFQIPLKKSQKDKGVGKIDLISYNEQEKKVYLLELKAPHSDETPLRAILEIDTYFRILDHQQFLKNFKLLPETKIVPAILLPNDGSIENVLNNSSWVNALRLKLGVVAFHYESASGTNVKGGLIAAPIKVTRFD